MLVIRPDPTISAAIKIICLPLFQGVSREDAEIILTASKEMEKIWTDAEADGSVFDAACRPMLKIMCREISKQKKRLGGDFAVAHAVVTRYTGYRLVRGAWDRNKSAL